MTDAEYDRLYAHAVTDRQREVLARVRHLGGYVEASDSLGVTRATVGTIMRRIKARADAADAGIGLMDASTTEAIERNTPEGANLLGTSIYTKLPNGDSAWVKTKVPKSAQSPEDILQRFADALDGWDGPATAEPVEPPTDTARHLLSVYLFGDPHIGMLAHAAESGRNFDLKIAERNLTRAVRHLVEASPDGSRAVFIQLGDFFHADNQSNQTPRSGAQLDVDGRYHRVIEVGIRTMVTCIDLALAKHDVIDVINNRGNHDPTSSQMLAQVLAHHYRDEPRVRVSTSPEPYQSIEFGKVLLVTNHGEQAKGKDIPGLIAATKPEAWGRAQFRHCYLGHVHHSDVTEYPGMTVEYLRTLAPRDAWHAAKYSSGQSMCVDVWDSRYGFQHRNQVGIEKVEAGQ